MQISRNPWAWGLATLLSASLAIWALSDPAAAQSPPVLALLCKPLTTVLILGFALSRLGLPLRHAHGPLPAQARWLLAGLLASLGGDIALLWPQSGFVPGLASFLLAHLCYIRAFSLVTEASSPRWPWAAFALLAALVLSQLWPGIEPGLRAPVLVYVLCLAAMAAQAWRAWLGSTGPQRQAARWAAWGGALFMRSDTLIAIDKFAWPMPPALASLGVLSTYWLAQWWIVCSLRPPHQLPRIH